jgi:hypothetical protein
MPHAEASNSVEQACFFSQAALVLVSLWILCSQTILAVFHLLTHCKLCVLGLWFAADLPIFLLKFAAEAGAAWQGVAGSGEFDAKMGVYIIKAGRSYNPGEEVLLCYGR